MRRVNVDGVVFGVRRLAQVMDERRDRRDGVARGPDAMPSDAIYSLTKHAVVGFVRSVAPLLEPIRLNAVCPGIADTPMIDDAARGVRGGEFPLLAPDDVAEAVWQCGDEQRSRRVLVRAARPRVGAVSLPEPAGAAREGRASVGRRSS